MLAGEQRREGVDQGFGEGVAARRGAEAGVVFGVGADGGLRGGGWCG